ncbi:uncharacterized protein LOC128386192 [Panonychus citri]|uniref:uncharacterized protein LOC128386192 n=1 Tax=Panonychus citri TaxID=50023 RepID=UPI002306E6E1|nr:uncharacterized protein LOC128386192 [Panonychus citri]
MWSSFLIIPTLFIAIQAVTLLDFSMEKPNDNFIIHSVLTDASTSEQWHLSESVAGKTTIRGKIQVSGNTHKFEVFYHKDRDENRLLLSDGSCTMNSYLGSSWSNMLPGVDKPLVNMIIMLGPSLIFRLNNNGEFTWKQETIKAEEEVRGVKVTSYSTLIGTTFKLIISFRSDLNFLEGLRDPMRIIFEETKSSSVVITEKFILDYYSFKPTNINLDKLVEVTPGYGCVLYFQPGRNIPMVSSPQVHLTFIETYSTGENQAILQTEKVEIFADIETNYLRVNQAFSGSSSVETVYDTDLGIGYSFNHSICGNIYLPNEWPFAVDYWESTRRSQTIGGLDYSKIVTTFYYATESDENGHYGKHLVPTSIISKGTAQSKYINNFYRRRDIHEFQDFIEDFQYESAFQVNSCNNDWGRRKSITLLIGSRDSNGLKIGVQNVFKLRNSIRNLITSSMRLSPLRIVDIDISFTSDKVQAELSIIEKPRLEESFETWDLRVDANLLNENGFSFHLNNVEECLKFLASNTGLKAVAYCGSTERCLGIKDIKTVSKATTKGATDNCKIFVITFGNLNHLNEQIALKDIDETFKKVLVGSTIELFDNNTVKHELIINEILDTSEDSKSALSRQAFSVSKLGAKLNINQSKGLVKSFDYNFGHCYRYCEESKEMDCSVFSYCYNSTSDSFECLVASESSVTNGQDKGDNFIVESGCTVYKRNLLLDYKKLPSKGLNDLIDYSVRYSSSVEDCASKCSQSADCHLFEYCNSESLCFLHDKSNRINKLDHQTNNLTNCNVYLLKASNNFRITGSKLVTDVIQTETHLDLDQCCIVFQVEVTKFKIII